MFVTGAMPNLVASGEFESDTKDTAILSCFDWCRAFQHLKFLNSFSSPHFSTDTGLSMPSDTCVLSYFSRVLLCATLWAIAHHAPLSMGFSRQRNWSMLPCPPPPGDFPDPGIKPVSLTPPALAARLFTTSTTWK